MGKFTQRLVHKNKPTGDCYEQAAQLALHLWMWNESAPLVYLVHGRPILARPPHIRYGHAWVEIPVLDLCINAATGKQMRCDKETFYRTGQIVENDCFFYTAEQTAKMLQRFGHYGPWEGPEGCPPITKE